MNVLRIAWIGTLVLLLPLMGVGFFSNSQQQKEKVKLERRIKKIKIKVEALNEKDPSFMSLKEKGLIALKKFNKVKDNWWYLGELEGIKKKFKPTFRNISSSKVEDRADFKKYSRLISMSSTYPEAVDLIHNLETTAGFQVDGLKINTSDKDDKKHDVQFWLSFLRVKQSVIDKLAKLVEGDAPARDDKKYYKRSLHLKPVWKKGQRLARKRITRDPFINLKKRRDEWVAQVEAENKAKEIARLARLAAAKNGVQNDQERSPLPVDLSKELVLRGILSIKGTRMAILDARYEVVPGQKNLYRYNVKIGDFVGEKEVISIENKRVILKSKNRTYYSVMQ